MLRRLAIALAVVFAAAAILVTIAPVNALGHGCGTWVSPEYTDLKVATDRVDLALGEDVDAPPELMQAACQDRLDSRRSTALVLVFFAVAAPLTVNFVAGSRRKSPVATR